MAYQIQLRRDTAANWTAVDPVLAVGEPGIEIDTGQVKIGNGLDSWTALSYTLNIDVVNNIDGGSPNSTYLIGQQISGGTP